ncbi:MAG TPA: hypothetical protein VFD85_11890, partial [Gemmatimonadales bacterium]|nr:hypothetical protein [Gemmatimonadales bacterium]
MADSFQPSAVSHQQANTYSRARSPMEIFRSPKVTLIARPQFVEPAHLPVKWNGDASDGERL